MRSNYYWEVELVTSLRIVSSLHAQTGMYNAIKQERADIIQAGGDQCHRPTLNVRVLSQPLLTLKIKRE